MLITAGTNRSFATGVEMFNELEAAKLPTSRENPKYKKLMETGLCIKIRMTCQE